jgi:hypothetical protein
MSTVSLNELLEAARQLTLGPIEGTAELDGDPMPNGGHPDDGVLVEFTYEGATFQALITKT